MCLISEYYRLYISLARHVTAHVRTHKRTHARTHACTIGTRVRALRKKAAYAMQTAMHACAYIYLVTAGRAVCMHVRIDRLPCTRHQRSTPKSWYRSQVRPCPVPGNWKSTCQNIRSCRCPSLSERIGGVCCVWCTLALWPLTDPRTQHPSTNEPKSLKRGWCVCITRPKSISSLPSAQQQTPPSAWA